MSIRLTSSPVDRTLRPVKFIERVLGTRKIEGQFKGRARICTFFAPPTVLRNVIEQIRRKNPVQTAAYKIRTERPQSRGSEKRSRERTDRAHSREVESTALLLNGPTTGAFCESPSGRTILRKRQLAEGEDWNATFSVCCCVILRVCA
jgi:hypothetical protein